MDTLKQFEIRRGNIFFRENMSFKTAIHEKLWIISMKMRGFVVVKVAND